MLKFTAKNRAGQELDHDGGASAAGAPPRSRAGTDDRPPRHRTRIRRRWPLVAIAVIALAALFAPPPSSGVSTASKQEATSGRAAQTQRALQLLSTGAPMNAVVLGKSPAQVAGTQVQSETVVSGLAANGIPTVALNAYRVAATRMDNQSSCGIDWSLLAGIGRVESNHGRFGGATLSSDGTSAPKILGPALNGVGFAFIRDTDHGAIDGDTTTDRAVGPMQFIPATWRSYAVDGNGDGVSDPFNINDAALAAAHYLCVAGGNLTTDAGQRQAVMAYNHSDSYVNEVLALAHAYAAGIPVADLPLVGNTTGAIPAPGPTYAYAPASPGPAIGASDTTPATGDTVGNQPYATAQPATAQSSDSGSAPAADAGTPAAANPSTPVTGGAPSAGTTGTGKTTGTSTGGGSTSGGTPAGGSVSVGPITVPVPVPVPTTPAPAPTTTPVPVPAPVENLTVLAATIIPVPGVNCHTKVLGAITLPLCPS